MSRKGSCKVSTTKGAFSKSIPETVRDEINTVVKTTKQTAREQSLTFCRIKNKNTIFVSDYAVGKKDYTEVKPCNSLHGENAERIGDLHTHPTQLDSTIGITPSTADIVSTIADSVDNKIPQIGCVTGPDAKMIHCMQPKAELLSNKEKLKGYNRALAFNESSITEFDPFLRENVAQDFEHAWYSRKNFNRINPKSKDVIHDAFLNSHKFLKFEDIHTLEKGNFCDIIADLNLPDKDERVALECRKQLKVRNILGFEF